MALDLTQAKRMLDRYMEAEDAVLDGRTITFEGRSLTLVDLPQLRAGRQEWERKVNSLERAAAGRSVGYSLASFD